MKHILDTKDTKYTTELWLSRNCRNAARPRWGQCNCWQNNPVKNGRTGFAFVPVVSFVCRSF